MLADMVAAAIVENRGHRRVEFFCARVCRLAYSDYSAVLQRYSASLVREQADGVLSSAAVPRAGLWPATPPLCRCAEYTIDQLLHKRGWRSTDVPQLNQYAALATMVGETPLYPNQTSTQLWRLVCTAQRHKGGGRRPGDSRGAVHTKCQGEHRDTSEQQAPERAQKSVPSALQGTNSD
jgi:hypothetical protein